MLPVVALVGRPNVGKSTLFNRLTRSRDALVVAQHLAALDPADASLLGRLVTAAIRDAAAAKSGDENDDASIRVVVPDDVMDDDDYDDDWDCLDLPQSLDSQTNEGTSLSIVPNEIDVATTTTAVETSCAANDVTPKDEPLPRNSTKHFWTICLALFVFTTPFLFASHASASGEAQVFVPMV